ncbi:MAG TPA: PQQ-dependent catabolism-associated CXXCW motif protein [Rhodopila sp.]|nr:PQQ-dependent catabolism-associated CXXCW motif protein [Rhodopila sp.]
MIPRRAVLAAFAGLLAGAAPDEPLDYRMEEYRAPTPATLRGATVLDTAQAHALWVQRQAVFVDVLPQPPRPPNLPAATIWRPRPRHDIPGSLWLPDTGYGALAPVMDAYFRQGLDKASAGDKTRMLVFYCLRNCWMSWNAAKRALSLGYTRVAWYPEGTDGWEAAGFPLELREPEPRPDVSG